MNFAATVAARDCAYKPAAPSPDRLSARREVSSRAQTATTGRTLRLRLHFPISRLRLIDSKNETNRPQP
jgi:hypothetical protein